MKARRDRKYKAFWGVFLFSASALMLGKLTGTEWITFAGTVYGLYMAGNVGEHYTKRGQNDVDGD